MNNINSIVFLASLLLARTSFAQVDIAEEPDIIPEAIDLEINEKSGWNLSLKFGSSINFTNSRNVIGQPDGDTKTIGIPLAAAADYYSGRHEWRNALSVSEMFTRTPLIPEWVKSADKLGIESIYLYHLLDWIGSFGRLASATSLFPGWDVRSNVTEYVIQRIDGDIDVVIDDRLPLTDSLRPLVLKQSVGLFLQPLAAEAYNLEFRLGPGVRETIADGQFAISDNGDTPAVEVVELESFNMVGSEIYAGLRGKLSDGKVSYQASGEFFTPLLDDLEDEKTSDDPIENTNVELSGLLSFKLVDWASLDYELSVVRQPQLLYYWQIRNTLMLTILFATQS